MGIETSMRIEKDFFSSLPLQEARINPGEDKPGFELEEVISGNGEYGFRVFTKRVESQSGPLYTTTIFKGPEPSDIVIQSKRFKSFETAVQTHQGAVDCLMSKVK